MLEINRKKQIWTDETSFNIAVYIFAIIILSIVLYPLIFVLSASFSDPVRVIEGKVWLWPSGFTLEPYKMVFSNESIWISYKNTILYTVVGTSINVFITIIAAYPLSRKDLPGRDILMFFIAFTMFFNGGLIPSYLLVKDLNMINTLWAMVIPNAIATYNLIVMRTFFQGIPTEIQESAWMDGCSNIRLLFSIIIPLSKPIIAVMLLFYGVMHWNAYFNALIYLRDRELLPLQLILREILILNQSGDDMGMGDVGMAEKVLMAESIKYSAIVISSLPMLLLYPFLQKYFVKGVMIGSIKG
jgi:putative aldouronate transport system permease protein